MNVEHTATLEPTTTNTACRLVTGNSNSPDAWPARHWSTVSRSTGHGSSRQPAINHT